MLPRRDRPRSAPPLGFFELVLFVVALIFPLNLGGAMLRITTHPIILQVVATDSSRRIIFHNAILNHFQYPAPFMFGKSRTSRSKLVAQNNSGQPPIPGQHMLFTPLDRHKESLPAIVA